MRNTMRENVAEHSYHVGLLAHLLCEIGNSLFGKQLNADRAAAMALFHDATEVFTGDLPTPVKHHNPKMLASFREIETLAAERLLSMVPAPLQQAYAPLLAGKTWKGAPGGEAPDEQPETRELARYLKAADMLDAYLKCVSELAAGNREFAVAKGQIEASLHGLAMPEVAWFLEHLAPGFGKTLDELSIGPQEQPEQPE